MVREEAIRWDRGRFSGGGGSIQRDRGRPNAQHAAIPSKAQKFAVAVPDKARDSHPARKSIASTRAPAPAPRTYTLPHMVPPNATGMHPSLAITYNSASGDGSLGMGGLGHPSGRATPTSWPRRRPPKAARGTRLAVLVTIDVGRPRRSPRPRARRRTRSATSISGLAGSVFAGNAFAGDSVFAGVSAQGFRFVGRATPSGGFGVTGRATTSARRRRHGSAHAGNTVEAPGAHAERASSSASGRKGAAAARRLPHVSTAALVPLLDPLERKGRARAIPGALRA